MILHMKIVIVIGIVFKKFDNKIQLIIDNISVFNNEFEEYY